jgi:hypothetical protein
MKYLESTGTKATKKDIDENFSPFSQALIDHLIGEGFICQPNVPFSMSFDDIPNYDADIYALTEKGYLFLDNHQRIELLTESQKKQEFRRGFICGLFSGAVPQIIYIIVTIILSLR